MNLYNLIAGFVCHREAVLEGGCCDQSESDVQQFVCDSCINNGCCSVYEHCVSCCLQPEKVNLKEGKNNKPKSHEVLMFVCL